MSNWKIFSLQDDLPAFLTLGSLLVQYGTNNRNDSVMAEVQTNGAIFKLFYADEAIWVGDTFHEDTLIRVDGKEYDSEIVVEEISDGSVVEIVHGYVVMDSDEDCSFGEFFNKWLAKQSQADEQVLVVRVATANLDAVKAAIEAAGGQIQ